MELAISSWARTLRLALLLAILAATIVILQTISSGSGYFVAILGIATLWVLRRGVGGRHLPPYPYKHDYIMEDGSAIEVFAIRPAHPSMQNMERKLETTQTDTDSDSGQPKQSTLDNPDSLQGAESDARPSEPMCSIYCASESDAPLVVAAVERTLGEYGILLEPDGPPIIGSWRQLFKLNSAGTSASKHQLQKHLREAEQALKNRFLEEPGAQVTKTLAESVCCLIREFKDVDDVVVHLPRLLFVKQGGLVRARALSETEALELDANRHIVSDPVAARNYIESLECAADHFNGVANATSEGRLQ